MYCVAVRFHFAVTEGPKPVPQHDSASVQLSSMKTYFATVEVEELSTLILTSIPLNTFGMMAGSQASSPAISSQTLAPLLLSGQISIAVLQNQVKSLFRKVEVIIEAGTTLLIGHIGYNS